jgi:diguanylate cyclase (GGDEF)-like protein/PAS domain S-box-containing protein
VKQQKKTNDSWLLIGLVLAVTLSATLLLWQNTYRDNLLVAGLAGSLLLTLLVWSLAAGRSFANARLDTVAAELIKTEFRWKSALEGAGDGVWDWDTRTDEVIYSQRWKEMLQYKDDEIINKLSEWHRLLHPEDKAAVMAALDDCVSGRSSSLNLEMRLLARMGDWHWILLRGAAVSNNTEGRALRVIGTNTDISTQKHIELALLESDRRFRGAFEHAAVGMALMDMNGRWLQVNKALCQMSGYSESELLSKTYQEMTHPDDHKLDSEFTRKLYLGEIDHYHMEKRYFRNDGETINTLISVSLVRDLQEKPVHYVLQVQDISARKRLEQQVQHQATHDELTGLPNRRLLYDRLLQAINQCRRHQRFMAVMFIDIDHFKSINDTYGHDFGDEVLRQTSMRLQHCIRETDTLARQGGDEFVAVLTEIATPQGVGRVASAIAQAMLVPLLTNAGERIITLSIGIAVFYPDSEDTVQVLLKKADTSLCEVKRAGRNAYRIYV